MDKAIIYHFVPDRQRLLHEYIVIVEADANPGPDAYCTPGFRLHGTHRAEIESVARLPVSIPLMMRR